MGRKALFNLISCVLSIIIIISSGIFAFSKIYRKEKEIIPEPEETTLEQSEFKNKDGNKDNEEDKDASGEKTSPSKNKSEAKQSSEKNEYDDDKAKSSSDKNKNEQSTPDVTISEKALKKEADTLGFLWDPIEEVFYSSNDPWQRNFGYNELYDFAAQFIVIYYDTIRVKFNYGGYDWLVQFWKGQYGFILIGAEVGVYYKPEGSNLEHYLSKDDSMRLKVGYTCYDKDEVIFSRKYQDTWWLTGFVEGKLDFFNDRSEMAMDIRITLKNSEMRDSFVGGLKKCGFKNGAANRSEPDTFYTYGNDVYIFWQKVSQM